MRFREDVFGLDNDAILKATRRFFLRKKTSGSWDKDKWTTQIQGAVGDDAQKVFDVYNAYMHAIIAVRVKAVEEWYDSDEELEDEEGAAYLEDAAYPGDKEQHEERRREEQQPEEQQQQQQQQHEEDEEEGESIVTPLREAGVLNERFEFVGNQITPELSVDLLTKKKYRWNTFLDELEAAKRLEARERGEEIKKETLEERQKWFNNFVCEMKTACAVSLTDEQLGALDDYFADLVDELKRDMEAVCEENEKQCQNAITAFVDEIRQNAAKTENDDALRTAAEEALGVVILFPGPDKGTKERLENVEALLKMKLDTPDEKEREEVSKAYRKAFDF